MKIISTFDGAYDFLSNFYEAPFKYQGILYPTNEHFFQAMKTLDINERKKIAAAETPGQAKRMGRKVVLREDWEEVKEDIMRIGLECKFEYPCLREKLLATGDAYLVEGTTWHDNEWGNCTCEKCKNIVGKNKLGTLLMQVREKILDVD